MASPEGEGRAGGRAGAGLGAALRGWRDHFFVGREGERRLFAACLADPVAGGPILNVHGPGGVGKSALLDAFRRLAEDAGALWVYVDVADLPRSPERAAARLATLLSLPGQSGPALGDALGALHAEAARRPVAVALDSYEAASALDRWLREAFLARLPERAAIVIAGRHPLEEVWRGDPAWRQLVRPVPLAPFDLDLTREFLARHGVADEALVGAAWVSTRGHPLALALAAALVRREGAGALARAAARPEVVAELARRWLREAPDGRLRELVEAAAVVRRFDQDLLAHLSERPVSGREFRRLAALSFVRLGRSGWSFHGLVRSALVGELRWRAPTRLAALRRRALEHCARRLTAPDRDPDWGTALEEFFHLLGDALIGAAFFPTEDGEDADELEVLPAGPADLPDLQAYFHACRRRAEEEGPAAFEVLDPETGERFTYPYLWVDFVRAPLDFPTLVGLGPGAVRVARDARGALRGVSVVIPVNARTLPFLEAQPVTRAYFRALPAAERRAYTVPEERTAAWFIRHLHTCRLEDAAARGALFRDLFQLAFRDGRLLTSSPAPFFQDLLRRCGFVEVPGGTHHDFGADCPSPTYILDVRGPRLAHLLTRLIHGGQPPSPADEGGDGPAGATAGDPAGGTGSIGAGTLAAALAERLTAWAAASASQAPAPAPIPAGVARPPGGGTILDRLTPREREVALAVLDGLSNAEIADRLGIALLTVKKHLTRIFEKVQVASRTQLIRRLLSSGV